MDEQDNVTIVVLAQETVIEQIQQCMSGSGVTVLRMHSIHEVADLQRAGKEIQIAILPDTLSGTEWWELWGKINLFEQRPEIIVYSYSPTFELWTGVLEFGGVDVVAAPIRNPEFKKAVSLALESYFRRVGKG